MYKTAHQHWSCSISSSNSRHHHHHLFWKRLFLPRSARVRRLPIWRPSTYPWTPPIQNVNQAFSYHPQHILSKSSYFSPYISPRPTPPFYRPTPNHPISISSGWALDSVTQLRWFFSVAHSWTQGKNLTFFQGGSTFPGGSYIDIFPGKCKISKITVLNCYLAVNCPKPIPLPALFWQFSRGGWPLLQGSNHQTPLIVILLKWTSPRHV